MAVTLQCHQLVDLLGAVIDDTAEVVASQVDEHHVLGPLLRVLDQFSGQPAVVLVIAPPPPGAGDGPRHDPAAIELDERLGG